MTLERAQEAAVQTDDAKVLELVVFSLRTGTTREELLGTAGGVSSWLAEQPGFVSRSLVEDGERGRWIDVVWWRSLAEATAAAELATSAPSCAPMFGLIDLQSTLMVHGERVHTA